VKLIHFSDTHLGFNDLDTLLHAGTRLCNSKLHNNTIHFTYFKTIILEYFLLSFVFIIKIYDEVFESQDEN